MNNREFGALGERAVEKHLVAQGAKILARNYRCPLGEIDLIARMDGAIVFVEVKRRSGDRLGRPAFAVDRRKQAHIARAARWYLKQKKQLNERVRFDVVEVLGEEITHLRAAFYPPP